MTFVPFNDFEEQPSLNLAPMIDFLFLMLAVFACLAVTRVALRDTEISLVKTTNTTASSLQKIDSPLDYKFINIAVTESGLYKWVTDVKDHPMATPEDIAEELIRHYENGLLPHDKLKTQVLLKIDKNAPWDPILKLILAIRDAGFEVRSVYEPTAS